METTWSPEAVVGYRVWSVRFDRMDGMRTTWPAPHLEARCTNPDPIPPPPHEGRRCQCGIYAAKTPQWLTNRIPGIHRPQVAMGRVEMWGRVIEHRDGYRAQYARVTDIAVRTRHGVLCVTEAHRIAALFDNPNHVISMPCDAEWVAGRSLVAALTQQAR